MSVHSDRYDKLYSLWASVVLDCNLDGGTLYYELDAETKKLYDAADGALTELGWRLGWLMDREVEAGKRAGEAWAYSAEVM